MPLTNKLVRGVQNIKTLSGRVDVDSAPYKAYMKLSILEMEKCRKNIERRSSLEKLRTIDLRFQEIEIEKQRTLQALETRDFSPLRRHVQVEPVDLPFTDEESFKIRY